MAAAPRYGELGGRANPLPAVPDTAEASAVGVDIGHDAAVSFATTEINLWNDMGYERLALSSE